MITQIKKKHRIVNSEGDIFINSILCTSIKNDNINHSVNKNDSEIINKLSNDDMVESDK